MDIIISFCYSKSMLNFGGGGGLVAKLCSTLATPWTSAYQAPLSMRFSRQEYWSAVPSPSPWMTLMHTKYGELLV